MVGLHHKAHRVLLAADFDDAGSRTDAAFKAVADGAFAGSHISQFKVFAGIFHRLKQMLLVDCTLADVVQVAVVALAHHRVDALHRHLVLLAASDHVLHQSVVYQSDVEGVGQRNRCFQCAQLFDLNQSGSLAKTVPDKAGCQHLVCKDVVLTRQHDGHAGLVLRGIHCAMTYLDSFDIGDFVVSAGRQLTDTNAIISDSFLLHLVTLSLVYFQLLAALERLLAGRLSCWSVRCACRFVPAVK